jgi:hypothetical protein
MSHNPRLDMPIMLSNAAHVALSHLIGDDMTPHHSQIRTKLCFERL